MIVEQQPVPDLSIVVVAYARPDLLRATLASVFDAGRGVDYEIVVVDNGPQDAGNAWLRALPQVQLMRAANRGFAAANNLGIARTRGRYVLLLNPDTELPEHALSDLVCWMDAHPTVGMAGPRLVQPDGTTQPYSFGSAPTPLYLLRRLSSHLRGSYLHRWDGTTALPVDWVAGTCAIVRRAALAQVGPLDERFFLYFEDVDWGMRFGRAGWGVVFVPTIAITHVGGGSVGASASRYYDRSLVLLYRKYYGAAAGFGLWLLLRIRRAARGRPHREPRR